MSMSKRRLEQQEHFWIPTAEIVRSPGHPFYERLNRLLDQQGFDRFVEERCASFYAEKLGRPSIPPGVYFRMLLIGYFEGIEWLPQGIASKTDCRRQQHQYRPRTSRQTMLSALHRSCDDRAFLVVRIRPAR
jgi:hypothetical protein